MNSDDIKELVKSIQSNVDTITTFWNQSSRETEHHRLKQLTEAEDFWRRPDHVSLMKQFQAIHEQWEIYHAIEAAQKELPDMADLFAQDQAQLALIHQEALLHARAVRRLKIALLLADPSDKENCFVSINAGAGGTESQDWTEMLLRMYVRFAEREGLSADVMDYQPGEAAGIKSATLFIKGKYAYGLLKGEQGVHRLIRISPYDANKRRHTSFAAVLVLPEAPAVAVNIDEKELRIDTYRAGGAGGQHVNKTESAVRITHLPTGIVVQCQNERSQRQNKETALKMLMARLVQREAEIAQEKNAAIERKKIEWGSQIRSYVLHPYKLAKDHRTEIESPQPDLVLDGDLMPFIEAFLIQQPDKRPT